METNWACRLRCVPKALRESPRGGGGSSMVVTLASLIKTSLLALVTSKQEFARSSRFRASTGSASTITSTSWVKLTPGKTCYGVESCRYTSEPLSADKPMATFRGRQGRRRFLCSNIKVVERTLLLLLLHLFHGWRG